MPPKKQQAEEDESALRIAIVSADRCRPGKCNLECKNVCPVNRSGSLCIEVEKTSSISTISEQLCIGCGSCVKKCPYHAIQIIRLPSAGLMSQVTHRYGRNGFRLHRLPQPRPGEVLGLIGTNGIGKSTALGILGGKLRPNLGRYADKEPPAYPEIIKRFRGSDLQIFFTRQSEGTLRAVTKTQYIDLIKRAFDARDDTVGSFIEKKSNVDEDTLEAYKELLDLHAIWNRRIASCSGGELQRFAIAEACVKDGDVYMFDEPSSYLDIRQRMNASRAVRSKVKPGGYVIVIEHDLAVLDYMSDYVCCLYGTPGAYGVVTQPAGVREGINQYLSGFLNSENMRFRPEPITFRLAEVEDKDLGGQAKTFPYPNMSFTLKDGESEFKLDVEEGSFGASDIVVLLGQNGTGKTTLVKAFAGLVKPDGGQHVPELSISYKPQTISPKFGGTVEELLQLKLQRAYTHAQFQTDVFRPLQMDVLMDRKVQELSGGEQQRVAITLCLGKPADLYLLDEPSAFLDCEQRLAASKAIKRFIMHSKKTAFVVEHDFIMASYLAEKVIVYSGTPAVHAVASAPMPLLSGMNEFLRSIDVTLRRDPENLRPRVNKLGSVKDKEQKASGMFFVQESGADAMRKKIEKAKKRAEDEDDEAGVTDVKAMVTKKKGDKDKKGDKKGKDGDKKDGEEGGEEGGAAAGKEGGDDKGKKKGKKGKGKDKDDE